MTTRIVLAEDEVLSSDLLVALLDDLQADFGAMNVMEICRTGADFVAAVKRHQPDLVFVDVNMPSGTGVEATRQIREDLGSNAPAMVFTTAYAQHALNAFDVAAVDYLLKPLSEDKIRRALNRFQNLSVNIKEAQPITVTMRGSVELVRPSDLEWVEACGDYVVLHTADGRGLTYRSTLKALEEKLSPHFSRTHRSHLVNFDFVRTVNSESHGDATLVLKSGKTVALSRRYRSALPVSR